TPESTRLLGLVCPPEQHPTGRIPDSTWAATPVDRLAHLCRHHRVELGLVTNGRFWVLVWAPRGKATAAAVFDAVDWPEAAERTVVRAFRSLLSRRRFFGVPPEQRLERLFADSADNQEEITEADRKSTRLNSSHVKISYAVFCLKKKKKKKTEVCKWKT